MQFIDIAGARTDTCAWSANTARERSELDSENGVGTRRELRRRVVRPVDLRSSGEGGPQPLESRRPNDRDGYGLMIRRLCDEGFIERAMWGLLAAAMRSRHSHLLAAVLHCLAASPLLGIHLHIGNHAGHCGRQIRHQQEDQSAELTKGLHLHHFRIIDPIPGFNGAMHSLANQKRGVLIDMSQIGLGHLRRPLHSR